METKEIRIEDYNYELPEERIAKFPVADRESSKLLVYDRGNISSDTFRHLPDHLPHEGLMIFNDTKVIQARLHFRKNDATGNPTGALIEVFLLEPALPADYEQVFQTTECCTWLCLIGNQKKWKEGALCRMVSIAGSEVAVSATHVGTRSTSQMVEISWKTASGGSRITFADILDAMGELPIPPYLNRDTEESDKTTYQTVYSRIKGSVAAPTAGLHFTERVLADIDSQGLERDFVTLHVGAGTFRPVKSDTIGRHDMHTEHIAVRRQTIQRLIEHDGKAIAVGTTSVRTLESLYVMGQKILENGDCQLEDLHVSQWEPYEGNHRNVAPAVALSALDAWMDKLGLDVLHSSTQIIIAPGYKYRVVTHLITNFHQPQSTLLLLVSAFIGDDWHKVYNYALENGFRFLSYGDSSLLIPKD